MPAMIDPPIGLSPAAARHVRPANYLLVKLATRCNLKCSYCYWFRDETVYSRPPLMSHEVEDALLLKLERHLVDFQLPDFYLLFHGGEPTLFGKERFGRLASRLRDMEQRLGVALKLGITTNGVLIDDEWVRLFQDTGVGVTVSLDGPPPVNDARRFDFAHRGAASRAIRGLERLRSAGIEPGVLAVCDPASDPRLVTDYFVNELGVYQFDILVPDATHEDQPSSIARYYQRLFDLWYDELAPLGVRIRYLESIVAGLSGYESHSESIGYGPNLHFTLLTDGSLEALDTVRVAQSGITRSGINILTHEIQEVVTDPLWQELLEASVHLAPQCAGCVYHFACGGGHIASRWSDANRFNNPSVYCADLIAIFRHVWRRIAPDLMVTLPVAAPVQVSRGAAEGRTALPA